MTEQIPKRPRGCFFYGCIVSLSLLLVIVVAALVGVSYAKRMINDITDSDPAPLPAVQMSPDQIAQVQQRVSTFRQALSQQRPADPLSLTGDEIDALISTDHDLQGLKGKLHVTIEGSQLKGDVSVPMSEVGLPFFHNRYLNGTAALNVSLHNGILVVTAQSITVKGKPLPAVYMNKIRAQNLAQVLQGQPGQQQQASAALDHIQDIEVKDGKLIIVPKTPPSQ